MTTIPENLSLCLIFLIAQTVKNLLYSNNLVRKLAVLNFHYLKKKVNNKVCENLGEIDVICTEKTGVLTTGKMQPVEFWNQTSVF